MAAAGSLPPPHVSFLAVGERRSAHAPVHASMSAITARSAARPEPSAAQTRLVVSSCQKRAMPRIRTCARHTWRRWPRIVAAAGAGTYTPAGDPGWIGGCYVHAEGSRATSQGCGEVVDMRGSHNDATLAS